MLVILLFACLVGYILTIQTRRELRPSLAKEAVVQPSTEVFDPTSPPASVVRGPPVIPKRSPEIQVADDGWPTPKDEGNPWDVDPRTSATEQSSGEPPQTEEDGGWGLDDGREFHIRRQRPPHLDLYAVGRSRNLNSVRGAGGERSEYKGRSGYSGRKGDKDTLASYRVGVQKKPYRQEDELCPHCARPFPSASALQAHLPLHLAASAKRGASSVPDPVGCEICHEILLNRGELRKHTSKYHAWSQFCQSCFQTFPDAYTALDHYQQVHEAYDEDFSTIQAFLSRTVTGSADFGTLEGSQPQTLEHEAVKYTCLRCFAKFAEQTPFNEHCANPCDPISQPSSSDPEFPPLLLVSRSNSTTGTSLKSSSGNDHPASAETASSHPASQADPDETLPRTQDPIKTHFTDEEWESFSPYLTSQAMSRAESTQSGSSGGFLPHPMGETDITPALLQKGIPAGWENDPVVERSDRVNIAHAPGSSGIYSHKESEPSQSWLPSMRLSDAQLSNMSPALAERVAILNGRPLNESLALHTSTQSAVASDHLASHTRRLAHPLPAPPQPLRDTPMPILPPRGSSPTRGSVAIQGVTPSRGTSVGLHASRGMSRGGDITRGGSPRIGRVEGESPGRSRPIDSGRVHLSTGPNVRYQAQTDRRRDGDDQTQHRQHNHSTRWQNPAVPDDADFLGGIEHQLPSFALPAKNETFKAFEEAPPVLTSWPDHRAGPSPTLQNRDNVAEADEEDGVEDEDREADTQFKDPGIELKPTPIRGPISAWSTPLSARPLPPPRSRPVPSQPVQSPVKLNQEGLTLVDIAKRKKKEDVPNKAKKKPVGALQPVFDEWQSASVGGAVRGQGGAAPRQDSWGMVRRNWDGVDTGGW